MKDRVRPTAIYAGIFRTYRERVGQLLLCGAIVFVPLGLIDALAEQWQVATGQHVSALEIVTLIVAAVSQTMVTMVGEVFYSGVVAQLIAQPKEGRTLREMSRHIRYGRLVAVDLLLAVAILAGFIAFVIPAVLIAVWFSLAPIVVELEARRIRASFKRSRQLVKGHFWGSLAVLLPTGVVTQIFAQAAQDGLRGALGHSIPVEWLAESLGGLLLTPIYALGAVLLAMELMRRKPAEEASD